MAWLRRGPPWCPHYTLAYASRPGANPSPHTRTCAARAAWALIPDDDDEDLVEKAKARRGEKLKAERGTEKKFVRSEGFSDASLAPVQKAVLQLAVAGSQLSEGNLGAVQATLRCP